MKKLILLSLLLFGCLTNYAQDNTQVYGHSFYKVTFHKPGSGTSIRSARNHLNDGSNFVYTIITTNGNQYRYKETRALSKISDSIFYYTEEPKTLHYHTWQKIWEFMDPEKIDPDDWETDFKNGKAGSSFYNNFGYGWDYDDDEYVICRYSVNVTYDIFRCECGYADNILCSDYVLDCKYSFELPCNSSIRVATSDNPNKKDLNINLPKGQTSFSVSAKDITDKIGFNTPFDLYIICQSDYKEILKTGDVIGKTHFKGIQEYVPYPKSLYILDNKLVIKNKDEKLNEDLCLILEGKTVSQNYNAVNQDIPEGKYQLQISDKHEKYCQVNLNVYVPKVEYQYIDNAKQHTHWYDEDYTEALILKPLNVDQKPVDFIEEINPDSEYENKYQTPPYKQFKYTPDFNDIQKENIVYYEEGLPKPKKENGEYVYKDNAQVFETEVLYSTPYYISCYPDLKSITLVPKDMEHSIYTTVSINKLKAYKKIGVTKNQINQPHCNYDDAVIKINGISEGIGLGDVDQYTFKVNSVKDEYQFEVKDDDNIGIEKDKEGVWSISVKDHELNTISLSIFDKKVEGDKGRDDRMWTISYPVNRPNAIVIPAPSISHPLCTFDSNGSIAINTADVTLSYPGKTANYTWSVIKGDKDNQTTTPIGLGPTISNLPAGFYQVELNNDNCIATGSYELIDPPLLEFEWVRPSDAKCYGYSDGSIFTNVKGGTPGYKYSWNVGATSNNLLNIPKGKYKLTVWDAHECKIQTDTIDISEPTKVENNFIAHDYSICQDSELEIDAGTFADYIWKNPQGKTLDAKNILTLNNSSPEGKYYLKTIRYDDCFAEDFINITQSKESLKMNFLLPSDIYNDDYAKIVETSSHELDSLKWSFSENLIGDFPKDSTTLTISTNALDKLSTYKIKLTGYYKGCVSTVTKNLNISNLTRPEEEYIPDFYDSDEILDCRIGPNPNNGNFTLFLDLDCAKDAVLTIYSISSYKYVLREKLVGLQNYEHSINQNLQQGLYILEVKTPKSIRRIKFEVTK